jgi:ATP-dependent Clp protease protease subunit
VSGVPGWTGVPGFTANREPPTSDGWTDQVRARLFEQRVVLLSGDLDPSRANQAAAELMTLDATGDSPVQLRITCGDGDVDAALSLMDVVDLMGVPVHATCLGLVGGPVLGVLAACAVRACTPHSRFHLFEPPLRHDGTAHELEQFATLRAERWRTYCSRLATLVGVPGTDLRADLASGRFLSAREALAYGLVDTVAGDRATIRQLRGPVMGFGAPR